MNFLDQANNFTVRPRNGDRLDTTFHHGPADAKESPALRVDIRAAGGCPHAPASPTARLCLPRKRVFDLMKDFGTSKSTKIDSIFDSLLVPR
ncbi:MAG: hypothetical protein ABW068_12850, partial [Candidatus Thiodiazotropha sp.]